MTDLPKRVDIHEEGPSEGVQIEPAPYSILLILAPMGRAGAAIGGPDKSDRLAKIMR